MNLIGHTKILAWTQLVVRNCTRPFNEGGLAHKTASIHRACKCACMHCVLQLCSCSILSSVQDTVLYMATLICVCKCTLLYTTLYLSPLPIDHREETGEIQTEGLLCQPRVTHHPHLTLPLFTVHHALPLIPSFSFPASANCTWSPNTTARPPPSPPSFVPPFQVLRLEVSSSRERVYVYLHPGAVVNGVEVRPHGPHFVFTISSTDTLEGKLREAQENLGVDPSSYLPVIYRKQSDVL